MDVNDKIRALKADVEKLGAEEKAMKARIEDLKRLVEEKSRKQEALDKLKAVELQLLEELGL